MNAIVNSPISRHGRFRRTIVSHPHWWLYALSVIGWGYFFIAHWGELPSSHGHHHSHTSLNDFGLFGDLTAWVMMVYAMMLPMMAGAIRFITQMIPRYLHVKAISLCILGYSAMWLATGVSIDIISRVSKPLIQSLPITIEQIPLATLLFICAAAWNQTHFRRRFVVACSNGTVLRIHGWKAYKDAFQFGVLKGWGCVGSCIHIMVALLVAGHNLWVMALVTAVLIYERIQLPRENRLVMSMCLLLATYYLFAWWH